MAEGRRPDVAREQPELSALLPAVTLVMLEPLNADAEIGTRVADPRSAPPGNGADSFWVGASPSITSQCARPVLTRRSLSQVAVGAFADAPSRTARRCPSPQATRPCCGRLRAAAPSPRHGPSASAGCTARPAWSVQRILSPVHDEERVVHHVVHEQLASPHQVFRKSGTAPLSGRNARTGSCAHGEVVGGRAAVRRKSPGSSIVTALDPVEQRCPDVAKLRMAPPPAPRGRQQ